MASTPSRATTMSLTMLLFLSARSVSASSLGLSSTRRITLLSMFRLLEVGEGEIEGCPLAHGPLGPDPAPVTVDDTLDGGEADARALELFVAVETLERAEKLSGVCHVEARAVVADEVNDLALLALPTESYLRRVALRCELPGVAQKVREHDLQQALVAARFEVVFDADRQRARGVALPQFCDDRARQLAQAHGLAPHLASRDARELQHVVNQLRHILARAAHLPKVVLAVLVELVLVVFQQRLAEAVDVTERRA